tara:strand:- start:2259 stop:2912 length:654 start_codon:yes stop_codon:yes gene_type:complete
MNIIDTRASDFQIYSKESSIKNIPLYKFKTIEYKLLSEDYTDIVFQSIAAVKFFQHHHILNKNNIYSMGRATYQSLLEKGFESTNPEIPGSAGLIKVIENRIKSGKFLIVKGRDGLDEIFNYLKNKKVEADQVCCYKRIKFDNYDDLKEDYFLADAIIFPSTLAVKIFFKEIYLNETKAKFFGISNRIVASIENLGFEGVLIDYFSNDIAKEIKNSI